jgi:nicotinamidase-related amidase
MPLTTIDATPALIVVDLQQGVTGRAEVKPVLGKAATLAAEFRRRSLPVVLVTVDGGAPGRTDVHRGNAVRRAFRSADWAELAPELESTPSDIRITKQRWGAFTGTDLYQQLQQRGVTQVVVCGIATSMGVESTARAAHEHGYHVVLAVDAMADTSPDTHRHSIDKIFPRLGETATTAAILAAVRTRHHI